MHRLGVLCLSDEQRQKGVVAFSSGNFGQGLAAACGSQGVGCTVVMPGDAPLNKEERARAYGADVVRSPIVQGVNREVTAAAMAHDLSLEHGYTLLHPFEDHDVMVGQGTCGLEIKQQVAELGLSLDDVDACIVPVGGGGLAAGVSVALREEEGRQRHSYLELAEGGGAVNPARAALYSGPQIWLTEPRGYDDHANSLLAGEICPLTESPVSVCDSLQAVAPGQNTFSINRELAAGALSVSDDEVREAMVIAHETLQLVLEPGGAVGLAAVLTRKLAVEGKTVVVIASGGNLTYDKFTQVVGRCTRSSS